MTPDLLPGPFRTLTTPEGTSFPYYLIPFDKDGTCEGARTREHLLGNLATVTDIFVFSHGWNNDWSAATKRYESFIVGCEQLRRDGDLPVPKPYQPLLVGIFWPSQIMEWFADESGPGFAAGGQRADVNEARQAAVRDIAESVPRDSRARFERLLGSAALEESEANELAQILSAALAGVTDSEAGRVTAPGADDLLASARALEEPEPDYDAIGVATRESDSHEPAAAFGIGDVLATLDPRNLLKPFTVWQMKDRAGKVGRNGVAPLLADLLGTSDTTRIHLIGHSFGCKVVMTALSVMPRPKRRIESVLLLQAAVSQYAFAPQVPGRDVPGGFVGALDRVERPILATFSRHDRALTKEYHLAVRRHDDVGELQFAAASTPSRYGALGGFGPQDTPSSTVLIKDPPVPYDLRSGERILGVDASSRISGHGDISNKSTWWAEYCLLTAHQAAAPAHGSGKGGGNG